MTFFLWQRTNWGWRWLKKFFDRPWRPSSRHSIFWLVSSLLSAITTFGFSLVWEMGVKEGGAEMVDVGVTVPEGSEEMRWDEMRWDVPKRSRSESISPGSTWLSLFLLTSSGHLNSNREGWGLLAGDCFKDSRGGRKDVGDGEIGFRDNDVSVLCLDDYKGERKERRGRSQWRSREEASSFCSRLHSPVTTGWSSGRGWKLGCSDSTSRFVNDLGETLSWDVSSEAVV